MKKIIILLFICVSCGKSKLDQSPPLGSSATPLVLDKLLSCKNKCDSAYQASIEALPKYDPRDVRYAINPSLQTSEYLNWASSYNYFNYKSISCTSLCNHCSQVDWDPEAWIMNSFPLKVCTPGSHGSTCIDNPEYKKVYCTRSDYL